jgi:hypothetical protein
MIRRTPLLELQTAVFNLLKDYAAPVMDNPARLPEGTYINIGEYTGRPESSKDAFIQDVTLTLHVYSNQRAKKEVADYLNALTAILECAMPEDLGEGFRLLHGFVGFYEVFALADEEENFLCNHGVLRYHAKIQDTGNGQQQKAVPWVH